jgi:hypothetical protein
MEGRSHCNNRNDWNDWNDGDAWTIGMRGKPVGVMVVSSSKEQQIR